MKYRIKEECTLFYPEWKMFFTWEPVKVWNGIHHVYNFRTIDEARKAIDSDINMRKAAAIIKSSIKYHPYP